MKLDDIGSTLELILQHGWQVNFSAVLTGPAEAKEYVVSILPGPEGRGPTLGEAFSEAVLLHAEHLQRYLDEKDE